MLNLSLFLYLLKKYSVNIIVLYNFKLYAARNEHASLYILMSYKFFSYFHTLHLGN